MSHDAETIKETEMGFIGRFHRVRVGRRPWESIFIDKLMRMVVPPSTKFRGISRVEIEGMGVWTAKSMEERFEGDHTVAWVFYLVPRKEETDV